MKLKKRKIPKGKEFERFVHRLALGVVREKGGEAWLAQLMTAICIHETGWGKSVPKDSNNLYGCMVFRGQRYPYVLAGEARTGGKKKRFRKFESPAASLRSLYYLMARSTYYTGARKIYREKQLEAEETYRRLQDVAKMEFLSAFSEVFCSLDKKHGQSVGRIFAKLS